MIVSRYRIVRLTCINDLHERLSRLPLRIIKWCNKIVVGVGEMSVVAAKGDQVDLIKVRWLAISDQPKLL